MKRRRSGARRRARSWRRWWRRRVTRRRLWRAFASAPHTLQVFALLAIIVIGWFAANGVYQVARKPSELFFPVAGTLNKTPPQTWARYASLFERYSTPLVSPELLAALAQVEGAGNPVVRTYWRWAAGPGAFDVYRPASSSVGMYQITNGTFEAARRYCIRDHQVIESGHWDDWHACWFNALYVRVLPAHAVELTAAYLDRSMAAVLARHHVPAPGAERLLELGAVIHLCGAGSADAYVRRGLRLAPGERCGAHAAHDYVERVRSAARVFSGLRQRAG